MMLSIAKRLVWLSAALIIAAVAIAGVPQKIYYQALLTDSEDVPITVPTEVIFTIWDADIGGSAHWAETLMVSPSAAGVVSLKLGEVNPLGPDVLTGEPRYLGVTVVGDAEIDPRSELISGTYAMRVASLDGSYGGRISGAMVLHSQETPASLLLTGTLGDSITINPGDSIIFRATDADGNERIVMNTGQGSEGGIRIINPDGGSVQLGTDGKAVSLFDSDGGLLVEIGHGLDGGGSVSIFEDTSGGAKSALASKQAELSSSGLVIFGETEADTSLAIIENTVRINRNLPGDIALTVLNPDGSSTQIGTNGKAMEILDVAGDPRVEIGLGLDGGGAISFVSPAPKSSAAGAKKAELRADGFIIFGATESDTNMAILENSVHFPDGSQQFTQAGAANGLPQPGGTMTGPIISVGDPYIKMGKGNFGSNNTNAGVNAFVAGENNAATGNWSTVGGGNDNEATGIYSTVGGGISDTASGDYAVVSGGHENAATSAHATVGGGGQNHASNIFSTVGGGQFDTADGAYAVIPGGYTNMAAGDYSSIGGGVQNRADGYAAAIGGGRENQVSGDYGSVSGGYLNDASALFSTVGGGSQNLAASNYSTVGGGLYDSASGTAAVVGGGNYNTAGDYAAVGGGNYNKARGLLSTIGGGETNTAIGEYATVPGGRENEASGDYSFAAGRRAKANHEGSFVWADHTDADFSTTDTGQFIIRASLGVGINTDSPTEALDVVGNIHASGTITAGNSIIINGIANTISASNDSIRFLGANLFTTGAIEMGGFRLNSSPTDGYVLTTNDSGVGTWQVAAGGGNWSLGTDGNDVLFSDGQWGIARNGATLNGEHDSTHVNLGVAGTTGAAESQYKYATVGGGWNNSASGERSTISGGGQNDAAGTQSTVSGGSNNFAGAVSSTIGGGINNQANGTAATVGGGEYCDASGDYSVVAGGFGNGLSSNTASGDFSAVGGGLINDASGDKTTISGGQGNEASDTAATVGGGRSNRATGKYSVVGGGGSSVVSDYNEASGAWSVVGGGYRNRATYEAAAVLSGQANTCSGENAAIAGGWGNTLAGSWSFIGNGLFNFVSSNSSVIVGGWSDTVTGGTSSIVGGGRNMITSDNSFIGGGWDNTVSAIGSVILGGQENRASDTLSAVVCGYQMAASGRNSFVGSGGYDTASGWHSAVVGGQTNVAGGITSFVGGGAKNFARGDYAVIVGGGSASFPADSNSASGDHAAIVGGASHIASGDFSAIPGGWDNSAVGNYSFAAGNRAKANHSGSFVWGDATAADIASTGVNQFIVRASGGTTIYSNSGASTGVTMAAGAGSWSSVSDRNLKANFSPVSGTSILEKIAAMPLTTWNYKSQDESIRHIGPMAQDFYAAFGVGEDEKRIATIDADGVALAAIQGLYTRIKELQEENAELKSGQLAQRELFESKLASQRTMLQEQLAALTGLVETLLADRQMETTAGDYAAVKK